MRKLALFPLNIVVFPGEEVNLHVFEPRYKQLINDCMQDQLTFGIPSYVLNKIELGCEVRIKEITKLYEDGRMDIKTEALASFRVIDFWNPWGEKLYAGGEVIVDERNDQETDMNLLLRFKELASSLFLWLGETNVPNIATVKSVYEVAHKIGLKLEEEYQLLEMQSENERLSFCIEHLERLIPALERASSAQERIKQNGHFKHLDPLKF
ncbi:MAG: LON peptidase substrate-binding domain-containing protein [Ekhidna sp.]